jgi:hypothetical protein
MSHTQYQLFWDLGVIILAFVEGFRQFKEKFPDSLTYITDWIPFGLIILSIIFIIVAWAYQFRRVSSPIKIIDFNIYAIEENNLAVVKILFSFVSDIDIALNKTIILKIPKKIRNGFSPDIRIPERYTPMNATEDNYIHLKSGIPNTLEFNKHLRLHRPIDDSILDKLEDLDIFLNEGNYSIEYRTVSGTKYEYKPIKAK